MMDAKEFAQMLDGREIGAEILRDEEERAKESGLVVVFGYSDDCMELRGALYEECGCYNGGSVFVWRSGVSGDEAAAPFNAKEIKAVWCGPSGASWEYETDIPHETFNIYEEGDLYCVGIVFSVEDLV